MIALLEMIFFVSEIGEPKSNGAISNMTFIYFNCQLNGKNKHSSESFLKMESHGWAISDPLEHLVNQVEIRQASHIDFVHEKRYLDIFLETPSPTNVTHSFRLCRGH